MIKKNSENQVNMLVYTMVNAANNILSSFGLSDEDRKKFETIMVKFESHFVKKETLYLNTLNLTRESKKMVSQLMNLLQICIACLNIVITVDCKKR